MIEVNKENFSTEVLEASETVVVDFWGPSCQPCLKLMPDVEELAKAYDGKAKIVKLNSAENRRLCIDLKVMGLPSFLVFKDGKEVARISGSTVSKQDIDDLLVQHIG
jgi:thioredoxin 1